MSVFGTTSLRNVIKQTSAKKPTKLYIVGRANDASVFSKSALNKALQQNLLDIPAEGVFLAHDAFPLLTNILKTYTRATALNKTQLGFNYRLSRGRRVVENSFGI
jgi:hypothetical protein